MDISTINVNDITLTGLAVIGVVNVVTFYRPQTSSKTKFVLSIVVAFLISFIPADLGNIILTRALDAIKLAFAASGSYKLFSKAGGR